MVADLAGQGLLSFLQAMQKKEPNGAGSCSRWRGGRGCVKINCDGAMDVCRGRAGVGCVARSDEGGFVWAAVRCFNSTGEARLVEMQAVLFAIEIAKSKGIVGFVIESDDQGLVQGLQKRSDTRGPFSLLQEDILAQMVDCQIKMYLKLIDL
ncbi:hypothetical protein Cgig2_009999 [Carnegiea gigantea]|uniref:RNase H type-1 domain-containing protein n=1 Tax=Carnegiea gigantea TaxID=171969 RepID=A0A9Q1JWN8_9CARY|nr:hypothetical protein Cgig2_009999 [Carnegiea gigantea]